METEVRGTGTGKVGGGEEEKKGGQREGRVIRRLQERRGENRNGREGEEVK